MSTQRLPPGDWRGWVRKFTRRPDDAAQWELERPLSALAIGVHAKRQEKRYTRTGLATIAKVSVETVRGIEIMDADPKWSEVAKIAKALDCRVADLLETEVME